MNLSLEPTCVSISHLKILGKILGRVWDTPAPLQNGISAHRKLNHILKVARSLGSEPSPVTVTFLCLPFLSCDVGMVAPVSQVLGEC